MGSLPATSSIGGLGKGAGKGMYHRGEVSTCKQANEGGVLSFALSEETKQFLLAGLVIRKVREPRTLAICSCVSRDWRQLATDEELWENMCFNEWPSLKSSVGRRLVQGRGYRSFLATKMRLDYDRILKVRPSGPNLRLQDLMFFLDVGYGNTNIFSMVEEGLELATKISTSSVVHEHIFRFSAPFSKDIEGVVVPWSSYAPKWTRGQILDFEVTWSLMEKNTLKSVKLMHNARGRMVGKSCIFETFLPPLRCFWHMRTLGEKAEVEIQFREDDDSGLLVGRQISMGTLTSETCRYQSREQALIYLEYLFSV